MSSLCLFEIAASHKQFNKFLNSFISVYINGFRSHCLHNWGIITFVLNTMFNRYLRDLLKKNSKRTLFIEGQKF